MTESGATAGDVDRGRGIDDVTNLVEVATFGEESSIVLLGKDDIGDVA